MNYDRPIIDDMRSRPVAPLLTVTSAEKANMLIHYYRGELGRMTSWRDRIDRTTNWSITVVAGLLSVSLSATESHHGVLLFGMLLVSLFLLIEARRYRFFDVYRDRVRKLERHYFAQALLPEVELRPDWADGIARSLKAPGFLMSRWTAVARRLRRNYVWMYLILALAWGLKISTPKLLPVDNDREMVWTFGEMVNNATLGPVPGWLVMAVMACFIATVVAVALRREPDDGEFAYGNVHV